jgi:gas vesicle protein
MTSNGKDRIKDKFQELMNIIKEEAKTESQEKKQDIIQAVNDIKQSLESNWDKVEGQSKEKITDIKEKTQEKVQENLNEMIKDLEAKALKVQYTIQDKYSQGMEKKDEYIVKTADSLVEAITKAKKAMLNEKE